MTGMLFPRMTSIINGAFNQPMLKNVMVPVKFLSAVLAYGLWLRLF